LSHPSSEKGIDEARMKGLIASSSIAFSYMS
jgi:hypothetical protein